MTIADFCDEIFYGKEPNENIVCFRDEPDDDSPMAKMQQLGDWRSAKPHFTWSAPSI